MLCVNEKPEVRLPVEFSVPRESEMGWNFTAKSGQSFSISKCTDAVFLQTSMVQNLCRFLSCFISLLMSIKPFVYSLQRASPDSRATLILQTRLWQLLIETKSPKTSALIFHSALSRRRCLLPELMNENCGKRTLKAHLLESLWESGQNR